MNSRILIADDEPDMVEMLAGILRSAGYSVVETMDGTEALAAARETSPAAAVLDGNMPGLSGLEICRELRRDAKTQGIPVIMLTGRQSETDRIEAFEAGVDDYVTKPFSPRELILRLRALLRRGLTVPVVSSSTLRAGEIVIDLGRHQVRVGEQPVELTTIEFKLLAALVRKCEFVLSREALLSSIWGEQYEVEPRTIDTHLRRLRDKLGPAAQQIATVRGFGYRLTAV